jgi:phosphomannomutase
MAGVSGVRGVVGLGLTPEVVVRYAGSFAGLLGAGPVVFGQDSRPSGPVYRHAVLAALLGAGRDVLELGIVPTPTVQLEVERHHAAGGLALTASHNPVEWNALKFVGPDGTFLDPAQAARLLARAADPAPAARWDALGRVRRVGDAVEHHVERILALSEVDADAVRAARPRVVLDAVHGAGGAIGRLLLERLGCDVTVLFEAPTGLFPREPEPTAEHLGVLAAEVKRQGADLGLAFDPDVDRLSLVDETGLPLGEESTLPLAADHVLSVRPGPVVTNLSTSARLDAVAARHGQVVHRTPVGEANVVAGIRETRARVGGEGNGGFILPDLHLGRDAPAGAAVVLSGLVRRGIALSRWAASLPALAMVKRRAPREGEIDWARVEGRLLALLPGGTVDRRDGLRVTAPGEWVHLRTSGTEPILRAIAEAGDPGRAGILAEAALDAAR